MIRSEFGRMSIAGCCIAILASLFAVASVCADTVSDAEGIALFRSARTALSRGETAEAIRLFHRARNDFPLMDDYALFSLVEAYHQAGRYTEARSAAETILRMYPDFPLKKKVRSAVLREAQDAGDGDLAALYESYTASYPDDEEMLYRYARLLKDSGKTSRSREIFLRLYSAAGSRATAARLELRDSDITPAIIRQRAANLMQKYDFAEAEQEFRLLLSRSDCDRREALGSLAQALFRQKKYREAADAAEKAGDPFLAARSLYRAGEKDRFDRALRALIERKEPRAGSLLAAVAADRRREGDYQEAISIFEDVRKNYPDEAEEALWGIGWTHFMAGKYSTAAETFGRLHETYNDPRYLYWQARSREEAGEDAAGMYARLLHSDRTFYGLLAHARTDTSLGRTARYRGPERDRVAPTGTFRKIDILVALDMKAEAVAELAAAARGASTTGEVMAVLAKCHELGEFRRAIGIVGRYPYTEELHSYWYPSAFSEIVGPAAERFGLDSAIALSVMREESRFDPDAKSPAGAYGLMQLMPKTAYRLDRSLRLGIDRPSQLTQPRSNILLGVYYLSLLLREFGNSLPQALAAYNAGEQAVQNWMQRGKYRSTDIFVEDIPYRETRNYVKRVLTSYFQYQRASSSPQDFRGSLGSLNTDF